MMGYYTHGHVRCTLKRGDYGEDVLSTLMACRDRVAMPAHINDERLVALRQAFAGVSILAFWMSGLQFCASFESRRDECETLMEAIRPMVHSPGLAGDVWGYTSYEGDAAPLVLYSTRRLSMAYPEPDIVARSEAPCGS